MFAILIIIGIYFLMINYLLPKKILIISVLVYIISNIVITLFSLQLPLNQFYMNLASFGAIYFLIWIISNILQNKNYLNFRDAIFSNSGKLTVSLAFFVIIVLGKSGFCFSRMQYISYEKFPTYLAMKMASKLATEQGITKGQKYIDKSKQNYKLIKDFIKQYPQYRMINSPPIELFSLENKFNNYTSDVLIYFFTKEEKHSINAYVQKAWKEPPKKEIVGYSYEEFYSACGYSEGTMGDFIFQGDAAYKHLNPNY